MDENCIYWYIQGYVWDILVYRCIYQYWIYQYDLLDDGISGMYFVGICIYSYIHVYAGIYVFILDACRYLGLFSDHIVPSVLYRYTLVLRRADLVNNKGKPLVTNAGLEVVWKRLADRVVADTSMITMSTATHPTSTMFALMARKMPR